MDSESSKALVNLGDLAKPVETFVSKVSDAIGVLYAPTHVRRMAKAEADAQKIRTIGAIEVSEIEERGLRRVIVEQARYQRNIDNIAQKAIGEIRPDAEPEKLDPDWVGAFFEECRNISNPEMQNLWANILAGAVAAECKGTSEPCQIGLPSVSAEAGVKASALLTKSLRRANLVTESGHHMAIGLRPLEAA